MHFDVFNGDADGICSLIQLRLDDPRPNAMLVTGPKRDIELLGRVDPEPGDTITVLDVSMRRNRQHLLRVLNAGAEVFYADHHNPGDVVEHPSLTSHILSKGEMCTSAIVNRYLDSRHSGWAAVGAFGDNMIRMGRELGGDRPVEQLQELGSLINYNSYGASLDDLHFHPDALYLLLATYDEPEAFLAQDSLVRPTLRDGIADDLSTAERGDTLADDERVHALALPDTAASRRISGILGNRLARENAHRAHAVLTRRGDGFQVSLRAPVATRQGAGELARRFGGGGRPAAAGIDLLPGDRLSEFLDSLRAAF